TGGIVAVGHGALVDAVVSADLRIADDALVAGLGHLDPLPLKLVGRELAHGRVGRTLQHGELDLHSVAASGVFEAGTGAEIAHLARLELAVKSFLFEVGQEAEDPTAAREGRLWLLPLASIAGANRQQAVRKVIVVQGNTELLQVVGTAGAVGGLAHLLD